MTLSSRPARVVVVVAGFISAAAMLGKRVICHGSNEYSRALPSVHRQPPAGIVSKEH